MPENGRRTIGRGVDGYCYFSQFGWFGSGFGPVEKTLSYLTGQIVFWFFFLFFFSDREVSPSRVEMRDDDHEITG
jgi:hypothetical protein